MNAVVKKIETILRSSYDTKNYVDLIREIFPKVSMVSPDKFRKEFTNFSSHIEGSVHVGNYKTPDKKNIIIMAVQLKNVGYVENSRSTQRSYAKKLIENANADAAIIAFYTEGEPKWRLSFVRLDYEMKIENGHLKTKENLTPAKRYSYLVGENEPCHTAISRFERFMIDSTADPERPTLDDLENAFSVEKVTDEFFKLYCEKYHQLREKLEENEDFCIEAEQHNFTSAQFAKKLMGQIVFLYFLQKKGWLGVGAWPSTLTEKEYKNAFYARGAKSRELIPMVYRPVEDGTYRISAAGLNAINDEDEAVLAMCVKGKPWGSGPHNFMRKLFEIAEKKNQNFFDELLEPLFYDALNVNRGEQGYCPALHCRIPFLSGGLFEPMDGYDWEHNNFDIPNEVFSNAAAKGREADGILDIFDRYNFTMSEDEPMEREVAIDPEMLGKVFENLLEVNDRKSKGAFYTPREIVHYMCQESLINYLTNTLQIEEEAIREFILYGDFMKDEDTVKERRQGNGGMYISENLYKLDADGKVAVNRLNDMDEALKNVRVADPAVGSGAFPLGMLNEIVRARQNISAYMAITMNAYDTRMMYQMDRSPHNLKYETIKNCIFAADIEPSAVDIAQLRLWLSLVIDDEINPNAQSALDGHKNPLPLPNLESNILCGNSLIDEFEGTRLIKESELFGDSTYQLDMNHSRFESIVSALIDKQNELFRCDNTEKKKQLKDEIESLRDMVILSQLEGCDNDKIQRYQESKQMASKPYVLWQLDFARVFREKGGFDIVIGNPPYLKEIDYKEIFDPIYKTEFGKKYGEGKMNFWYFFFHKGMNILNDKGHLAFIAPNYFVAGSGATKLNDRIVNQCAIKRYIDFNKTKVFETADVQCMILIVAKDNLLTIPFSAYMFRQGVKREELGVIISHLDSSEKVAVYVVDDQKKIMSVDYKINFENIKFENILAKIEDKSSTEKLFKSTQGIVENPSVLNKKNIASVAATGVDVTEYNIGDEVFVINKRNIDMLNLNDKEKSFLREYHEPNEVNRYVCNSTFKNYLLYICRDNMDDISKYPNIEKHLSKYRPFMEMRRETQKRSNQWFHLHWPRKEELFNGEKIVYPQMCAKPTFAYSLQPFYTNMSANIIYGVQNINLKVLTCILNSELAHFWLLHRAKNRGIGLDIAVSVIDKFPVNKDILSCERLAVLAEEVIIKAADKTDYSDLDLEISDVVYDLYGISNQERESIKQYIQERTGIIKE